MWKARLSSSWLIDYHCNKISYLKGCYEIKISLLELISELVVVYFIVKGALKGQSSWVENSVFAFITVANARHLVLSRTLEY